MQSFAKSRPSEGRSAVKVSVPKGLVRNAQQQHRLSEQSGNGNSKSSGSEQSRGAQHQLQHQLHDHEARHNETKHGQAGLGGGHGYGIFDTDVDSLEDSTTVTSLPAAHVHRHRHHHQNQRENNLPHPAAAAATNSSVAPSMLANGSDGAAEHEQRDMSSEQALNPEQYLGLELEDRDSFDSGAELQESNDSLGEINHSQRKPSLFDGNDSYPPTSLGELGEESKLVVGQYSTARPPSRSQQRPQSRRTLGAGASSHVYSQYTKPTLLRSSSQQSQHMAPHEDDEAGSGWPRFGQQAYPQRPGSALGRMSPSPARRSMQTSAHERSGSKNAPRQKSISMRPDLMAQITSSFEKGTAPYRHGAGQPPPKLQSTDRAPSNPRLASQTREDGRELFVEGSDLDYAPDVLSKMQYSALHEESFDFDPSVPKRDELPPPAEDETLDERLKRAQNLDSHVQQLLCTSLPIDEWDQAGDWFVDRFTDLVVKFRQARRDKRQAAAAFEAEVHERHEAVEQRKRAIDAVLDEMKSEGQVLLRPATPIQKRRRKDTV